MMNPDDLENWVAQIQAQLDSQPTLRDQFAMAALQGLLAQEGHDENPKQWNQELFAEAAYMFADAMLEARDDTRR